jgi:methyl-accepting chemotaxis protein
VNISQRLALTLGIALLALMGIGGFGLYQQQLANARFEYLTANTFPSIIALDEMQDALTLMRTGTYRHVIAQNDNQKEKDQQAITTQDKRFDEALAHYEKDLIVNAEDRQLLEQDRKLMVSYRSARDALLQLSRQHKTQEAEQAITSGNMRTATAALSKNLQQHMQFNYQLAGKLAEDNRQAYQKPFTCRLPSLQSACWAVHCWAAACSGTFAAACWVCAT